MQKFAEDDEDDEEESSPAPRSSQRTVDKRQHKANAIDITEAWAFERLTPDMAANLVLVSMVRPAATLALLRTHLVWILGL